MPRDEMSFDNGGRFLWVFAFTETFEACSREAWATQELLCFAVETVRA